MAAEKEEEEKKEKEAVVVVVVVCLQALIDLLAVTGAKRVVLVLFFRELLSFVRSPLEGQTVARLSLNDESRAIDEIT